MSRPAWHPAAVDGISWTNESPLRGYYLPAANQITGIPQLRSAINSPLNNPWDTWNLGLVAVHPDAPLRAGYMEYLRDKTEAARALTLLDEWDWETAAGPMATLANLTELRRAIPVASNARMSAVLSPQRPFASGTYTMGSVHGWMVVYKDNVAVNRSMILCDFADEERMTDASVSVACKMRFQRIRNKSTGVWPDWPEPVSLRYIPASAIPDQEWNNSHAAGLWATIGGAAVLASASRADILLETFAGATSTAENVEGWVRVKLPDVPGNGKFWLGMTLPNDGTPVDDGGVNVEMNAPRWLYWSEPAA